MIWLLALIIGIINAAVLWLFELVGIEGTAWLWNDLLNTDEQRWLVFPTALALGLALTAAFKIAKIHRAKETSGDLLEELNDAPSNIPAILGVLLVGAVSLLAGASLGPEATLMAFAAGTGILLATRFKRGSQKQLLVLASVGALLVAFVSSVILVLIPLLILFQGWKKAKQKPQLKSILVVLVAGLASFGTITGIHLLFDTQHVEIIPPLPDYQTFDFAIAALIGFVSGLLALLLNQLIRLFSHSATLLSQLKIPGVEWLYGALAGLVLGFLYFAGGPTVEFSGKLGSEMLLNNAGEWTVVALISFIVIKLMATAWSEGTGYRGGLVFPSVFVGIALGLLFTHIYPELGGSGAVIGGISGMMTAVIGSPVMAAIFLVAALPVNLWPIAACALVGTTVYTLLVKRFFIKKAAS